ncbi:site-specific recombinase XerD [Limimaricola soesokkakensis]|uniref:Site-specific recombinase XerD n=1 Tax=Limimaricola soesokkakensis TaxID=1343159 RepID=A0A1X6ZEF0_9RHOB|nr:site-specific integrase [Limimaricola soesokkakensis]PSK86184.1 site-specific recombinase XerD [Limimaricola soesokkakensis]SLN49379.1 site-specific tyrosine recombinase XerC [Limimaricola soesokkakensis]
MTYRIGTLNGRKVVTFNDNNGARRRIRLSATSIESAAVEGYKVYREYWDKIEKDREWSISEIWCGYKKHLGDRSSGRNMLSEGKSILPFFGGLRPSDITEELVQTYISTRVNLRTGKPVSDGTLWTELGRLRDALQYARKRNWIKSSEITYIPRPSKPEPRDRWLRDPEIVFLFRETMNQPHLYLAVHLMLATAGRVTAVLELTWDRVNFVENYIDLRVVTDKRQKKRASVPITKALRKLLTDAKSRSTCDHVVEWHGKPIKSIKTAFNHAAKRAGLVDVTPHVMRHTAAVRMAAAGCPMERIAAYLGHSDPAITRKVYARFSPDHLRMEADAVDVGHLVKLAVNERRGTRVRVRSRVHAASEIPRK